MQIYIATKFENKDQFHKLGEMLRKDGHNITLDWTCDDVNSVSKEELPNYLSQCAGRCLLGVAMAEALIMIAHPKMAGAFVEFGIALFLGIPIIVVDAFKEGNPSNIFYHIPRIKHVKTLEEAVFCVKPLTQEQADFFGAS